MSHTAQHLREILIDVFPLLHTLSDEETSQRPQPTKWSAKEIIGHLIDSACNNHQKFIRTIAQTNTEFVGYQQNFWVETQQYTKRSWSELLTFWYVYNLHLAHLIEHTPSEVMGNTITIEGAGPFTLSFIMPDYVEHLKHHLLQILPQHPITTTFANVYNA